MIKGINLVPDEIRSEWKAKKIRSYLIMAGVFYAAALVSIFFGQVSVINAKRAELSNAETERAGIAVKSAMYSQLVMKFREIEGSQAELKKRYSVSAELNDKRMPWSVVLKKLSRDIPPNIWLKSLSTSDSQAMSEKKIRVIGNAASNKAIADLVFALENSGYCKDVALTYSQKNDIGQASVYEFDISAVIKKTDDMAYE